MQIRIDKQSEVPARHQLRQQIIFLISIGQLSNGTPLPSVRELARRLKIHHNTVSHVYSQLAGEGWLIKKRGSRMVVGKTDASSRIEDFADLDDLIDRAIRLARTHGYSLQQLTSRVRARLQTEPADHLLLLAPEKELAELLAAEIAEPVGFQPDICSVSMLQRDPSLSIGALLITPSYHLPKVEPFVPADRTLVSISYSPADEYIAAIRKLPQASVVGVVSVSGVFLETANGLLAPAIGRRHSFREFLLKKPARASGVKLEDYLPDESSRDLLDNWTIAADARRDHRVNPPAEKHASAARLPSEELRGFDLLFCDSIAYPLLKHRRAVKYRLISDESLAEIADAASTILGS